MQPPAVLPAGRGREGGGRGAVEEVGRVGGGGGRGLEGQGRREWRRDELQ